MFCSSVSVLAILLGAAPNQPTSTRPGHPKPSTINLKNLSGKTIQAWPSSSAKASVFIFLTHDCPIANSYAPEISRIERRFSSQGIRFYEVYSESDLAPSDAAKHHKDFNLKGTGLLDPHTKLAWKLGARISPEVFVLSQNRTLYHGRIDNTYASVGVRRGVTTKHELVDVLSSLAKGIKPQVQNQPALGCTIILKKS